MPDYSGPFDTKAWAQEEWYRHMLPAMPSGVIGSPAASATSGGLAFLVSGLNVGLDQGRANVGAAGFYRTGAQSANIPVEANGNASLHRRDRLVLRRSIATNTVTPVVIKGTAAASPVAPTITRSDTVWDETMFSFLVPPNNATTLTGVTDERRWLDPAGDTAGRGLVGYGNDGATISTTSASGVRPSSLINFSVHLFPGRIYEAKHDARTFSDQIGTVASVTTRISRASATATNSDPILCQSTAVIERAGGSGYLFPLHASDFFTVTTEADYIISMWVSRALGSGTVNVYPMATGRYTQSIADVRGEATSGPAGLSNVVQAL